MDYSRVENSLPYCAEICCEKMGFLGKKLGQNRIFYQKKRDFGKRKTCRGSQIVTVQTFGINLFSPK